MTTARPVHRVGFIVIGLGILLILAAAAGQKFSSHKSTSTPSVKPGAIAVTSPVAESQIKIDGQAAQPNQSLAAGLHDITIEAPDRLPGRYQVTIASDATLKLTNDQPKGAVLGGISQSTSLQIGTDSFGANGRVSVVDGSAIHLIPLAPQPKPTSQPAPTPSTTDGISIPVPSNPALTLAVASLPEVAGIPLSVIQDNPLLSVGWSTNADRALLQSATDQGDPEVGLYTLSDQKYTILSNVIEAVWNAAGDRMYTFTAKDADHIQIDQRHADGSGAQTLPLDVDKQAHGLTINPTGDVIAWYYPKQDTGKMTVVLAWLDGGSWKTSQTTVDQLAGEILRLRPDGQGVMFREIRTNHSFLTSLDRGGNAVHTTIEPLNDFWQWSLDSKSIWAVTARAEKVELGVAAYTIDQWVLGKTTPQKTITFSEPILWEMQGWLLAQDGHSVAVVVGPEVQTILLED